MMRTLNQIIIHSSATPPGMDIGADDIRQWHIEDNGWDDIGYHYVIRRNGDLEHGRSLNIQGAHAKGHNKTSIGVCLVGGATVDGKPEANFSFKQYNTLVGLVGWLCHGYGIKSVVGHKELANTECPSFNIAEFFK